MYSRFQYMSFLTAVSFLLGICACPSATPPVAKDQSAKTNKGESVTASESPKLWPLYQTKGAQFDFVVRDEVDPHAPDGKMVVTECVATFRVIDLKPQENGTLVKGEWKYSRESCGLTSIPSEWLLDKSGISEPGNKDTGVFSFTEIQSATKPICHTKSSEQMYGPGSRELCVDKNGLVSINESNLAGPRVTTLTRK